MRFLVALHAEVADHGVGIEVGDGFEQSEAGAEDRDRDDPFRDLRALERLERGVHLPWLGREVARGLGDEQQSETSGERPVLGRPGLSVAQARQQVAGERVVEHGERGGHRRRILRERAGTRAGRCLPSCVLVGHHDAVMQRYFGFWFAYVGPDPA